MTVLKTLFITAGVLLVLGVLFIYSGFVSVAADDRHLAPVAWVLETARERSIEARLGPISVPTDLSDDDRARRGAQSYAAMCQECHLGPGVEPTPLHLGLNPTAPELSWAIESGPKYLFWTIKHGIRMTGMPAWGVTHADEALWDVVAFLLKMPAIAPSEYVDLSAGAEHHDHSAHDHSNLDDRPDVPPNIHEGQPGDSPAPPGHEGHDHSH